MAAGVTALAVASALSGYLLHGKAQSARATASVAVPTIASRPVASSTQNTGSSTPTTTGASGPDDSTTRTAPAIKPSAPPSVPTRGNGKFTPVAVPAATKVRTGRVVTYSLRVEGGMHADTAAAARDFGRALLDRRGWQGVDHVRFVQITPAQLAHGATPQINVLLASPAEVIRLCAPLQTHGKTSCNTSENVVLNYRLWMQGVPYFKGHVAEYREYMVNHEVGHALGHGHQKCSAKGAYAPVMQQQTLGLHGCQAWPWPKRPNAAGKA